MSVTRHHEDVQPSLLDPAPRDSTTLLAELSDQGSAVGMKDMLERFLPLRAHGDVFPDVQKYVRFNERLGSSHRIREVRKVERGRGGGWRWGWSAKWGITLGILLGLGRLEEPQLYDERLQQCQMCCLVLHGIGEEAVDVSYGLLVQHCARTGSL